MDRRRLRLPPFEELDVKVRAGEWQMHPFPLGFVISEIRKYDTEQVLTVHLLSGERFDEWKEELVAHLKNFAKEHGCHAIEATCRLGLEESLKPLGFKRRQVVLRADV